MNNNGAIKYKVDLTIQLNLFSDIRCDLCKEDPGPSDKNPNLWNGFFDQDTKHHICMKCKNKHYSSKWNNTKFKGLYSEVPVTIKTRQL